MRFLDILSSLAYPYFPYEILFNAKALSLRIIFQLLPAKFPNTIIYSAFINEKQSQAKANSDATKTKWINIKELLLLAFDYKKIINFAIDRLKNLCLFTPLLFQALQNFSQKEIIQLYKTVLKNNINENTIIEKLIDNRVIKYNEGIYNFNMDRITFVNEKIFTTSP